MVLAPLAYYLISPQGPDLLHYHLLFAYCAAKRVVSIPTFSIPASALLPGLVDDASPQIKTFERLRQIFYLHSTQEFLVAILEGVC